MGVMYKIMRGISKRKAVRILLWTIARNLKTKEYKLFLNELAKEKSTLFRGETSDDYVESINKKGATSGPCLPSDIVDELVSYSKNAMCYADRKRDSGFKLEDYEKICDKLGKRVLVAQYLDVNELPVIEKLTKDPFILEVAAKYLQVKPKLVDVNLWWTFPGENVRQEDKLQHAHVFHYDLDDIKFIKFFFYLTDVGELDGPHVYVEGSHHDIKYKNTLIKSKRFTDEEILAAYGKDAIKVVTGPAGSCLIEDTITLHKGTTGVRNPRLILQLQYAVFDYRQTAYDH